MRSYRQAVDDTKPDRTVCDRCGMVAEGTPPLTWVRSVENGEPRYFCEACSSAHIRAIEGRLDSAWW